MSIPHAFCVSCCQALHRDRLHTVKARRSISGITMHVPAAMLRHVLRRVMKLASDLCPRSETLAWTFPCNSLIGARYQFLSQTLCRQPIQRYSSRTTGGNTHRALFDTRTSFCLGSMFTFLCVPLCFVALHMPDIICFMISDNKWRIMPMYVLIIIGGHSQRQGVFSLPCSSFLC
jgi:hypothetical protein